MAFLIRCSWCGCPKRVDEERAPNGAFPVVRCARCTLRLIAVPPIDGAPAYAFEAWGWA